MPAGVATDWTVTEGVNWRNPGFTQDDDHPVVAVSCNDAVEFAKWLSRETRQEFRLPSEAEWEYAVRSGSLAAGPADLEQAVWHRGRTLTFAIEVSCDVWAAFLFWVDLAWRDLTSRGCCWNIRLRTS